MNQGELSFLSNCKEGKPPFLFPSYEKRQGIEGGRKRVLIVDDEPRSLLWLKNGLEDRGLDAELVDSGIEAVEEVKGSSYDMVFLDLRMAGQGMDGVDTFDKIKKVQSSLPVVLMTGYPQEERVNVLKNEGN